MFTTTRRPARLEEPRTEVRAHELLLAVVRPPRASRLLGLAATPARTVLPERPAPSERGLFTWNAR